MQENMTEAEKVDDETKSKRQQRKDAFRAAQQQQSQDLELKHKTEE